MLADRIAEQQADEAARRTAAIPERGSRSTQLGGLLAAEQKFSPGRKGIVEMYYAEGARRGYKRHQIDGLLGNKVAESGLNPAAINPRDNPRSAVHPDSIGLGQWNDRRATELKRLAATRGVPWTDPMTQVVHTFNELERGESRAGGMLRNSTNVREATIAGIAFERPQGFTWNNPTGGHNFSGRLAAAQKLAGGVNPYDNDTRAFAATRIRANSGGEPAGGPTGAAGGTGGRSRGGGLFAQADEAAIDADLTFQELAAQSGALAGPTNSNQLQALMMQQLQTLQLLQQAQAPFAAPLQLPTLQG